MKRKIAACSLLLIVMAVIPAITAGGIQPYSDNSASSGSDNSSAVTALAASLCGKDFCDEAIKAMIILANTNSAKQSLEEQNADFNSNLELREKIDSIYRSNKELYIYKNGQLPSIPYAEISNGATYPDNSLPDFPAVSSPWDCLDSAFDSEAYCTGVSLRGVNYLCRRGFSAEEALLHYLPGFEIKT